MGCEHQWAYFYDPQDRGMAGMCMRCQQLERFTAIEPRSAAEALERVHFVARIWWRELRALLRSDLRVLLGVFRWRTK